MNFCLLILIIFILFPTTFLHTFLPDLEINLNLTDFMVLLTSDIINSLFLADIHRLKHDRNKEKY